MLLVAAGHDVQLDASGDLANPLPRALDVLNVVVIVAALASWVAWLLFQVPAYRRADGKHPQQLKWLYSGAAIFVVSLVIGVFVVPLALGEAPGWGTQPVVGALTTLGTSALPLCMGVAVLKYRLYEIDRIISRTLAYAIVTGVLAGIYAGLVLLATQVLRLHTPVAVAAATLAAAALFNPLRRRVQRAVDRRFNRTRYDADKTVAAFAARLKDAVDLDAVQADLANAVQQALEPAHVSVWISQRE